MNKYVVYNSHYQVLICKAHQYAFTSESMMRHFRNEHKELSLQTRQEIIHYASTMNIADAEQLSYSIDRITPIPYLKIVEGYQCQFTLCCKILGTLDSVKKHCKLEHEWSAKNGECWTKTRAQTFYSGNERRYFIIIMLLTVDTLPYMNRMHCR